MVQETTLLPAASGAGEGGARARSAVEVVGRKQSPPSFSSPPLRRQASACLGQGGQREDNTDRGRLGEPDEVQVIRQK